MKLLLPRTVRAAFLALLCCAPSLTFAQNTPGTPVPAAAVDADVRLLFALAALFNPGVFGGATTGWYEHDGYTYQYFINSNTYAGVRSGEVFVLGGTYGNRVLSVGTLGNVLALLTDRTGANVINTSRQHIEFEHIDGAPNLPQAQSFSLEATLPTGWSLVPGATWFSVSQTAGTTGDGSVVQVSLNANAQRLARGKHTALLLVRNASDQHLSLHIPVSLWVADPGVAVTNSTPDVFDFDVTHVVNDTKHGSLWFSDQYAKRVYQVDAASGHTERYFQFARTPEHMTLSPDGRRLYVALLDRAHSAYWWDEDQTGGVGIINLDTETLLGQFDVELDPYELAATSSGKLLVSGGSGQWTTIDAYDVVSGARVGRAQTVYMGTRLSLHPNEQWLYTSQNYVNKYDVSGTGIVNLISPFYGNLSSGGGLWAAPGGRHVYSAAGDVFLATSLHHVTKLVQDATVVDLAFDEPTNSVVVLTHTDKLWRYGMGDFRFLMEVGSGLVDPRFVEYAAGDVIVVDFVTGEYVLKRF